MIKEHIEELLGTIFDRWNYQKISIFCGAGISYNSGLPVVYQFIESILNKFELGDDEKEIIHNSEYPFEAFFEMLQKECKTDELLRIFNKGQYNTNHLFIAWLIKKQLVKNVITTNFDELIEQACKSLGLEEDKHYQVFRTERSFSKIDWHSENVNIIKIHGCASNLESMAINMKMVANSTESANKNAVIKNLFSEKLNSSILILGYSCSDVFDISPAIESITGETCRVILLEHILNSSEQKTEDIAIKNDKNPFRKFKKGIRIYISTDHFIELMWCKLGLGKYLFIKHKPTNWQNNIDHWYDCIIKANTDGFKHHICARLFYNLGEYEYSEKHYNSGIEIAYRLNKSVTVASEIGNLAMNYNALGHYERARDLTSTSLEMYRMLGDVQGELGRLQTLGNIYRNLGNYSQAELSLQSAVKLARAYGDPSDVCTGLGNLALVYNLTGEYSKAIDIAEEGMCIAHKFGIKQSEASQLSTLGIAYFHLGDSEKGVKYLLKSVIITRLIKDRRNESMALTNLATLYMVSRNFLNAIQILEQALPIAIELRIVQNEAMIYFNIAECYLKTYDKLKSTAFFQKALNKFMEVYPKDHEQILLTKRKLGQLS